MTDTENTTPDEPTEAPDAAEVESLEDIDAEPLTEADEAVTLVRSTAEDLNRAIVAAATKGGSVDKAEVDRQTVRLQARSLHALVELAYAGLFTPVASIEYDLSGTVGTTSDTEAGATAESASSDDASAKKGDKG